MRFEKTSLMAPAYSFPSVVGCSVMSVSHTMSGAGAVNEVVVHGWTWDLS